MSLFTSMIFAFVLVASAAVSPTPVVELGTSGKYAILTKTGISTVPDSVITGDIGVSPIAATAMTGFSLTLDQLGQFAKSTQIVGEAHAASYGGPVATSLTTAISNMEAAYNDAWGRPTSVNKDIVGAGDVLTTGVYTFGLDIAIKGDITFSGDDVFIIQSTGNIVMDAGMRVNLAHGAQAKNIFWAAEGFVEVGLGAHMEGILLAKSHVLFKTGSSLNGRILSQTACVLQKATITEK